MVGDEKRVKAKLLRDACASANRRARRLRTHVADSHAVLHVIFLNEPSVARHLYVLKRRLRERVAVKFRDLIAQLESRRKGTEPRYAYRARRVAKTCNLIPLHTPSQAGEHRAQKRVARARRIHL